jgi:hypothetical protein
MDRAPIKQLMAEYHEGVHLEAELFYLLVEWIPTESIEEILSFLDQKHKEGFIVSLRAIARPGWKHFVTNWKPSKDQLQAIQDYLAELDRGERG